MEEEKAHASGISLSKRKDVVNKTLLRSVKRYYTSLFQQFLHDNQYSKPEKRQYWMNYIDEFSKLNFSNWLEDIKSRDDVSWEAVKGFMASMVVPNNIKRTDCPPVYNEMLEAFSGLLYKYSIKRLETILKDVSVSYVLKHYIESGPLRDLLDSDATLSKNKHLYLRASKEIISLMNL